MNPWIMTTFGLYMMIRFDRSRKFCVGIFTFNNLLCGGLIEIRGVSLYVHLLYVHIILNKVII